ENPLDFLVEEYAVNYPFQYDPGERAELQSFLEPVYPCAGESLRNWFSVMGLNQPVMQTYVLLDQMCKNINSNFIYTVREEPGVQPPEQTLGMGRGSCRDFAALFVEGCRNLGLASRFVSGYAHLPQSEQWSTTTHAWAEVYLPGAGWKGFDPTAGEVTGRRHIPVAVARHPETVPPVAGSFVGRNGPLPELIVDVRVVAL
ncbi:MAG: transglutaminase family protein, partial [Gammaproteobacteria bacterium]|nr:transglutaminase family protein [Gammaproteobacteria bacterium]NIR92524.1 transglutaminase family protein [Gammaproteobacteria bacterium]NIW43396.1 transglutaminase family protein [Gammaproteobacteria bacterium]